MAILEPITSWYVREVETVRVAENPYHMEFKNGFDDVTSTFDASVECLEGDPDPNCIGNAECWEGVPAVYSCGAERVPIPPKLTNGYCLHSVAFVGYGGWPAVSFDSEKVKFSVDGWGWEYFNKSFDQVGPCPGDLCVGVETEITLVPDFSLGHCRPNPFNATTSIEFSILDRTHAVLSIFDATGREIWSSDLGVLAAGDYTVGNGGAVIWNGINRNGEEVASGVYFYRLNAGRFIETKRMVLVR